VNDESPAGKREGDVHVLPVQNPNGSRYGCIILMNNGHSVVADQNVRDSEGIVGEVIAQAKG